MWSMNFAVLIELYMNLAIVTVAGFLALAALLHCAFQRPDAFPAVGPLSKNIWLAILAGCVLVSSLGAATTGVGPGGSLGIFGIISLIASLIYLLDIRPAIRAGGTNNW